MQEILINADTSRIAIVHASGLPWVGSPMRGVERRMLERIGSETALATSIVRYDKGSYFHAHSHQLGEEYLVLEGTFCDEKGQYPVGTYVRNPPGSAHTPFTDEGCTIFVKLRQMSLDDRGWVVSRKEQREWKASKSSGHSRCVLHESQGVSVSIERLEPGAQLPARSHVGGEEIFIIDGSAQVGDGDNALLEQWSWMRRAGRDHPALRSTTGALFWTKRGHLTEEIIRERASLAAHAAEEKKISIEAAR